MKVDVFGVSDVGMRRERNEDSCLINPDLNLYMVADGMGGHVGGDFASKLAVETVEEIVAEVSNGSESQILEENKIRATDFASQLRYAIQEASFRIYREARENPAFRGMGTTAVVILVRNDRVYIANVGDSRGYLVRNGKIIQLTDDHSLVGEQLRAGVITEGSAKGHKLKNIITRSVGFQEDVEIDVITKIPREGDVFLLCSDGLSNMVDDEEMLEIIKDNSIEEACNILIDTANARGGDDNITVVLMKILSVGYELDSSDDESTMGI